VRTIACSGSFRRHSICGFETSAAAAFPAASTLFAGHGTAERSPRDKSHDSNDFHDNACGACPVVASSGDFKQPAKKDSLPNACQMWAGSRYVAARSIRLSASRRSRSLRLQAQCAPQVPPHPQVCPHEWPACCACSFVLFAFNTFCMMHPFLPLGCVVFGRRLLPCCRSDCVIQRQTCLSITINMVRLA